MSRTKINKAKIRKQGNYIDGRNRYILEKEIAGKVYTIALNPDKLWDLFTSKAYADKIPLKADDSLT